ncbi:hypothetical protein KKE03_01535 [Patescibacteria group bacterium]|nr:hypothetical protein [Patescibacteria group bacterium]
MSKEAKTALKNTFAKAGALLLVVLFLFLITWMLYLKFSPISDLTKKYLISDSTSQKAYIGFKSQKEKVSVGEELSAEIVLENFPEDITSFALRVICSWNEEISPLSAPLTGKVVSVSSDLEKNGWVFPIRQVKNFDNSWQIDLAGVNLSGEDTKEKTLVLGEMEFKTKNETTSLNCRIDPSLTKVLTKAAQDLALDLDGISYVISN